MTKTILILAANPKDQKRLDLEQEVKKIKEGLAQNIKNKFILHEIWAASILDMRRAFLNLNPNIVHFCGHGSDEEGLLFEDNNRQTKLISTDALAEFFALFSDKVECVVLNACYAEIQAKAIAKHISYVIGMSKAIGDTAAIEFAVAFYDALGAGKSIEFAHEIGRNAISLANLSENLIPVLKLKGIMNNRIIPDNLSYSQLLPQPQTETGLVGRESYLKALDDALASPSIRIMTIIADGGVGKSVLVSDWLRYSRQVNAMETAPLCWSFYNLTAHLPATVTDFFNAALDYFGFPHATILENEKPNKLKECFFQDPRILILDGIERLQRVYFSEPDDPNAGRIMESALCYFLDSIANEQRDSTGYLVVVTSRFNLSDLVSFESFSVCKKELELLAPKDGAKLLQKFKITGDFDKLKYASELLNGHPLALVLFASALTERLNTHDISRLSEALQQMHQSPFKDRKYRHTEYIMKYYSDMMNRENRIDVRSQIIMQMVGLFHRPMLLEQRDALRSKANFAKPLVGLSEEDLRNVDHYLMKCRLLLPEPHTNPSYKWDCHHLVRKYFGRSFKNENLHDWRQAHDVLYQHFCDQAGPTDPVETTIQTNYLYRAAHHACEAGLYRDALELYKKRILLDQEEAYNTNQKGETNEDIALLQHLLQAQILSESKDSVQLLLSDDLAWLHARMAFSLMCVGDLDTAEKERKQERNYWENSQKWIDASQSSAFLALTNLMRGKLSLADEAARDAINWIHNVDQSEKKRAECLKRGYVCQASVAHRRGNLKKASELFDQACRYQDKATPGKGNLCFEWGWLYHAFLFDYPPLLKKNGPIDYGPIDGTVGRAYELVRDSNTPWLAPLGLHQIYKARALKWNRESAKEWLSNGMSHLQQARSDVHLAEAYLCSALFYKECGSSDDLNHAMADVKEAIKIAQISHMQIHIVDGHLLLGNLYLDFLLNGVITYEQALQNASESYEIASKEFRECGYELRKADLFLLEARLDYYDKRYEEAWTVLNKAKILIDEMGYYGLLPTFEKVKEILS